jgi:hypothetical protein
MLAFKLRGVTVLGGKGAGVEAKWDKKNMTWVP